MHTVISSFDDRDAAQHAMDRLCEAGFAPEDMHMQHRELHLDGGMNREDWEVMEREVAVDRDVLESIGNFFVSLFGKDNPSGDADSYSRAVARGECVVVLDAQDETQARKAESLLGELGGRDRNVVPRSMERPLHEGVSGHIDKGGQIDRDKEGGEGRAENRMPDFDRATASRGFGEQRTLEVRDPPSELEREPGLRYADKDKPGR